MALTSKQRFYIANIYGNVYNLLSFIRIVGPSGQYAIGIAKSLRDRDRQRDGQADTKKGRLRRETGRHTEVDTYKTRDGETDIALR